MVSNLRSIALYLAPTFLGALLLFQVQPIIARRILPWYGGTPAVWTTCMLFFQVMLLVGYAYAHFLSARLPPKKQAIVHGSLLVVAVGLLAASGLGSGTPLLPSADWKPDGTEWPIGRIMLTLVVAVGMPYALLASTSPLLQSWFTRTHVGVSPYRLYALSNAGSLLGLVTYPFLIEPSLAMRSQAIVWAAAFVLFAASCGICALPLMRTATPEDAGPEPEVEPAERPKWMTWGLWLGLPALASLMLLALTNQICQEVAVVPFLWVVPLSLYLLSFIICFDHERWYRRELFVPALMGMVLIALGLARHSEDIGIRTQIAGYSALLFACCMVCHGELVRLKPSPRYLTAFYMAVATGGALGGALVALVAPLVFSSFLEVEIGLYGCLLLGAAVMCERAVPFVRFCRAAFTMLVGAAAAWIILGMPGTDWRGEGDGRAAPVLEQRNFYGLLRVEDRWVSDPTDERRILMNGTIVHGFQYTDPERRREPTSYYTEGSGVSRGILHHSRRDEGMRFGIVGLGSGSLAVYGREGDTMRFYDIDPDVVEVASDADYFTYLSDCPAEVDVVLGDARLSLERELADGSNEFDVLVLDAFSSDAVPAHLLTREAFSIYLQHMREPGGIIIVHVSNRVLDLAPVVRALAEHYDLSAVDVNLVADDDDDYASDWILMASDPECLEVPGIADGATSLDYAAELRLWTDDYHSLFSILY